MLGITTTFFYAILTGRAFAITFEHPIPFDILFDSPFIDWSRRWTPPGTESLLDRSIWADEELIAGKKAENGNNWPPGTVDHRWGEFYEAWLEPLPKWIWVSEIEHRYWHGEENFLFLRLTLILDTDLSQSRSNTTILLLSTSSSSNP